MNFDVFSNFVDLEQAEKCACSRFRSFRYSRERTVLPPLPRPPMVNETTKATTREEGAELGARPVHARAPEQKHKLERFEGWGVLLTDSFSFFPPPSHPGVHETGKGTAQEGAELRARRFSRGPRALLPRLLSRSTTSHFV